jgi:hypothetical protein
MADRPEIPDSPKMTDRPDSTVLPLDVNRVAADFGQAVQDGVYIAIGLGVLGFQRAQVRRVEWTRQLEGWLGQRGGIGSAGEAGEAGDAGEASRVGETGGAPAPRSELAGQLTDLASRVDEALAPARELGRQLIGTNPTMVEAGLETARGQLTQLVRTVDELVKPVRQQLEEQFDLVEQFLPPATRSLVESWRAAVAEPEQRLRGAIGLD